MNSFLHRYFLRYEVSQAESLLKVYASDNKAEIDATKDIEDDLDEDEDEEEEQESEDDLGNVEDDVLVLNLDADFFRR